MPVGGSQAAIARDEGRFESFGEGHIRGVVCSYAVAQLPDAPDKRLMRVADYAQIAQVRERLRGAIGPQFPDQAVTAQHVDNLQVEQVGRMQGLLLAEET